MNLTAHPYAVAAELAWKAEVLSGANRKPQDKTGRRGGRGARRGRWHGLRLPQRPRHTIRPV
jgi:hypothetical protein